MYLSYPKTPMAHYKVTLTKQERDELTLIMSKGKHTSQQFKNACILLNYDKGEYGKKLTNEQIAQMLLVILKQ